MSSSLKHRQPAPSSISKEPSECRPSTISNNLDNLIRSALTLAFHESPEWMRDNEYILSGYRRVQNSWKGCIHSLFSYFHNESVNVHTHLWPAFFFLFLLATVYSTQISQYATASWLDRSLFAIFLASATFCLSCSAIYHLSTCHSKETAKWCLTLDYCGIIVLIVGSFYPWVYYGFYCDTRVQVFYVCGVTIAGLGAAFIVLTPKYATPAYRGARATIFFTLGFFAIFPLGHSLISHGLSRTHNEMGFPGVPLSFALHFIGTTIYTNRIPERWFPGKFDYFFASHQIFHVQVVLAALAHYAGILEAFHHWHGVRGGPSTCLAH